MIEATWGPEPWTTGDVSNVVFNQAAHFIATASFGKVELVGSQTGWLDAYRTPPDCKSGPAVTGPANASARAAGFDPTSYGRVVYLLPQPPTCSLEPHGGAAGTEVHFFGLLSPESVEHELGHTFGMGHAGALVCGRAGSPCRRLDPHGDPYDVMGSGPGDYGALQKARAGWLNSLARIRTPGSYSLAPLEVVSSGAQALVIDTARYEYWIDHRALAGNDAALENSYLQEVFGGLEIHRAALNVLQKPGLPIDVLLPTTRGYVLGFGKTFRVPGTFSLRLAAQSGTTLMVRFSWIDHISPSAPKILKPSCSARPGRPLIVRWRASRDVGSGVDHYLVTLDGQPRHVVPAGRPQRTYMTTFSAPRPRRDRLTVVSVDRAGNQSRASEATFTATC